MTELSSTTAIWGVWRALAHDQSKTPEGFAKRLQACLDRDIVWIDHADIYDNGAVETLHGEAMIELTPSDRKRLKLITKCGVRFVCPEQDGVRVGHYRSDALFIRQQVEGSLARLRTEQVDLLLLHRPDYLMQAEETARALEDLVASGKVKAFGVSNFSIHQFARLQSATTTPLAAHQVELSPLMSTALDDGTLDLSHTAPHPLLAWSPLGGGRLFDASDIQAGRVREALARTGERLGETDLATLCLAWVSHTAPHVIPVVGTMSMDRLCAQLDGLARIRMDHQDWYDILEAGRGAPVP